MAMEGNRNQQEEESQPLLLRILVRMALGIALIMVLNTCFQKAQIDITVGLNPFSVAAVSTLGVPGVVMLYGIAGCKFL